MKKLVLVSVAAALVACANGPEEAQTTAAPSATDASGQTTLVKAAEAQSRNQYDAPALPQQGRDHGLAVVEEPARRLEQHAAELAKPSLSPVAPTNAAPLAGRMAHHDYPIVIPSKENRERYLRIDDNPVKQVTQAPVSTFSIDVDTGAYSNMRRFLNAGQLPPNDAVRVEELINYFPYAYAQPTGRAAFAVHSELAVSPWNAENVLLRIGIKGKDATREELPPANLVFLVDVSGSMNSPDKLPLLKSSLKLLINELRAQDRITLVTYAGSTQLVLAPTSGSEKAKLIAAIDALSAGGSTAGASGIQLAYQAAQQGFMANGINRILLATDGDFNVGISDFRQLKSMVEEKRKSGISLSTLGFGTGNYNEEMMEQLADVGNGAYSYIDSLMEGHKVLVNEMSSTLATIAQDVKIQVEFNPTTVKEYRLIGYENRILNREDFNNDKVDAGDIGAGHTVTALYELTPVEGHGMIDALKYQKSAAIAGSGAEWAHVKLRYKAPGRAASELIDMPVAKSDVKLASQASAEFRFAAAVAGFGQLLRGGKQTGQWQYDDAKALAQSAVGNDRFGYRGEFLRLIALAQSLSTRAPDQTATRH